MTEKRDLKWALEYMQDLAASAHHKYGDKKAKQAADMLRNGGPVVEKSERVKMVWCKKCDLPYFGEKKRCDCGHRGYCEHIVVNRKWTEREKIQIVTEKSEPTFEEIK